MVEWLNDLDLAAMQLLNFDGGSALDTFFVLVSSRLAWIPVYAIVLYALYQRLERRELLFAILLVIPLILVADQVSSGLLKPLVERPRPCHELALLGKLHQVDGKCGGPYGFVSSHAANFFALAGYLLMFFRRDRVWVRLAFVLVPILVAYSRVYLGVHYPGDVLAGGMIGLVAAWGARSAFRYFCPEYRNYPQSSGQ